MNAEKAPVLLVISFVVLLCGRYIKGGTAPYFLPLVEEGSSDRRSLDQLFRIDGGRGVDDGGGGSETPTGKLASIDVRPSEVIWEPEAGSPIPAYSAEKAVELGATPSSSGYNSKGGGLEQLPSTSVSGPSYVITGFSGKTIRRRNRSSVPATVAFNQMQPRKLDFDPTIQGEDDMQAFQSDPLSSILQHQRPHHHPHHYHEPSSARTTAWPDLKSWEEKKEDLTGEVESSLISTPVTPPRSLLAIIGRLNPQDALPPLAAEPGKAPNLPAHVTSQSTPEYNNGTRSTVRLNITTTEHDGLGKPLYAHTHSPGIASLSPGRARSEGPTLHGLLSSEVVELYKSTDGHRDETKDRSGDKREEEFVRQDVAEENLRAVSKDDRRKEWKDVLVDIFKSFTHPNESKGDDGSVDNEGALERMVMKFPSVSDDEGNDGGWATTKPTLDLGASPPILEETLEKPAEGSQSIVTPASLETTGASQEPHTGLVMTTADNDGNDEGEEGEGANNEISIRGILGPGPGAAVIAAGILIALAVYARTWRYVIPNEFAFTSTLPPLPSSSSQNPLPSGGRYFSDDPFSTYYHHSRVYDAVTPNPRFLDEIIYSRKQHRFWQPSKVSSPPSPPPDTPKSFFYSFPFFGK